MKVRRKYLLGFHYDFDSPGAVAALQRVLQQIRKHPRDWHRLKRRVSSFRYLPAGTLPRMRAVFIPLCRNGLLNSPGVVGLQKLAARRWPRWALIAVLAHECGHAVTTKREVKARGRGFKFDPEWALELCASRYVFKWGFEKEYRRLSARPEARAHIGGLPGQNLVIQYGARRSRKTAVLRVSHDFRLRRLKRIPAGLLETKMPTVRRRRRKGWKL